MRETRWQLLIFGLGFAASLYAVVLLTQMPVAILLGKIPDAPMKMILREVTLRSLPIAIPSIALLLLSWRDFRRVHYRRAATLLLAAPGVAFLMFWMTGQ